MKNYLSIGIVGLPNVGKSTLFKILTKQEVNIANYPFATIDPNVGVVMVPDERLQRLAEMSASKKVIPAAVEFFDIAGLVKGANKGEGLGNQFLSHIREVSAIVEVVRVFQNDEIVHVEANVDPIRDIEIIENELRQKDETAKEKINLLTAKPKIFLLNGEENDASDELKNKIKSFGADYLISDLSTAENISELIKKAYEVLGLISFFTTGEDETRAWTIKKGAKAPEAAGAIHSDFQAKFIRAEVINCEELLNCGGWQAAKQKGKVRLEGKEYVVQDGDVMVIRHG